MIFPLNFFPLTSPSQITCFLDRYPKLHLAEVQDMISVSYFPPDVEQVINKSLIEIPIPPELLTADRWRKVPPANILGIRFTLTTVGDYKLRSHGSSSSSSSSAAPRGPYHADFCLQVRDKSQYWTKLTTRRVRLSETSAITCGREGCRKVQQSERQPGVVSAQYDRDLSSAAHPGSSSSSFLGSPVSLVIFVLVCAIAVILALGIVLSALLKFRRKIDDGKDSASSGAEDDADRRHRHVQSWQRRGGNWKLFAFFWVVCVCLAVCPSRIFLKR